MIKEMCRECGAVGSATYPTFCDACGQQIPDAVRPAIIECGRTQLIFHTECAPPTIVQCNICGAKPETVGSSHIIHDRDKHLAAARKP